MNDKLIDFIICTNNNTYFDECCRYLNTLEIPEGMEAGIQAIEGASSMTSGYNYAQTLSDAKYRVYLHQDVFITNKHFIADLLAIFKDPSVGMVGLVGSPKLPESGVMWEGPRVGALRACNYYNSKTVYFSTDKFTPITLTTGDIDASRVFPVECADGLLLATQYDLPWREDLFDGWDFYDVSQGFEFRKAGYQVVVPDTDEPWVIHDDGVPNYANYDKYKEIFKNAYTTEKSKKYITHINTLSYDNIGDFVLSNVVQQTLSRITCQEINFINKNVKTIFDTAAVIEANETDAIVVGGGGLFFTQNDSQPHSWQWNIGLDEIRQITKPVFLFAVGYNQFRGQPPLGDNFREEINALAEKCEFIGLRNQGSIDAVRPYLNQNNIDKLIYQPCPTTIISKFYPVSVHRNSDFIAVNMAFDRQTLRFGSEERALEIMDQTIRVLAELCKYYKIKYYSHFEADNLFAKYLELYKIPFELVRLYENRDMEALIEAYSAPALVIGMRGHAQMIPFGCGVPILSIITHDKMKYFLEDIHHPEWGVDVNSPSYMQNLLKTTIDILDNTADIRSEIAHIQGDLLRITVQNVRKIVDKL